MPGAEQVRSPPPLSIDSLTLTDTDPRDAIRCAHKAGFDLVSLWLNPPGIYPRHLVCAENVDECRALLAETSMGVHAIEAIDLISPAQVLAARPMLELGASLGAKAVVAFNLTNPDRDEAGGALRTLAELTADCGLGVNVEPMPMAYTRTLAEARNLIADAGVDAGIVFDTYHFARNGESLADLKAIEPSLLRYVQVSDAPEAVPREQWGLEAAQGRLHPGEGDFALLDMLRLLPRDVPWAVEIPRWSWTKAGVPPRVQAAVAMEGLRDILDRLESGPGAALH